MALKDEREEQFNDEQIKQLFPELWQLRNVYIGNGHLEGFYQPRNLFDRRMVKAVEYIENIQKEIEKREKTSVKIWKSMFDFKNIIHIVYLIVSLYVLFIR